MLKTQNYSYCRKPINQHKLPINITTKRPYDKKRDSHSPVTQTNMIYPLKKKLVQSQKKKLVQSQKKKLVESQKKKISKDLNKLEEKNL